MLEDTGVFSWCPCDSWVNIGCDDDVGLMLGTALAGQVGRSCVERVVELFYRVRVKENAEIVEDLLKEQRTDGYLKL